MKHEIPLLPLATYFKISFKFCRFTKFVDYSMSIFKLNLDFETIVTLKKVYFFEFDKENILLTTLKLTLPS